MAFKIKVCVDPVELLHCGPAASALTDGLFAMAESGDRLATALNRLADALAAKPSPVVGIVATPGEPAPREPVPPT